MRVTLGDVAARAGVSVATVSRALRADQSALIAPATRDRVVSIAEALGYVPNMHARALSGGKAPLISLVTEQTDDYMLNVKALRLFAALTELDRRVSISHSETLGRDADVVETLLRDAPEAVVIRTLGWPMEVICRVCSGLHRAGVYTVVVDYYPLLPPEVPCDHIAVDRLGGAALAVRHLLELGHRNVALIVGHSATPGREAGYDLALKDHGIWARYVRYIEPADPGDTLVDAARKRAVDLMRRSPEVTAIYVASDLLAVGVVRGLEQAGLRVPEDVAVVGHNDEPWAAHLHVPLSSLTQPIDELIELSSRALVERLAGESGPWRRCAVPMTLVTRESSRPAGHSAGQPGRW